MIISLVTGGLYLHIILYTTSYNKKLGIALRKKESSKYKLRWEIERAFSIIKEILVMEHTWHVKHRNYDIAIVVVYHILYKYKPPVNNELIIK